MASPAKQASSRWGSFLSQAVAGVEAKLDTILADDYDDAAQQSKESKPAATPPPAASPAKASPSMMFSTQTCPPYRKCIANTCDLQRLQGQPQHVPMIASKSGWPGPWPLRLPARTSIERHPLHKRAHARVWMRQAEPRPTAWIGRISQPRTAQRPSHRRAHP